ncbi:MAG: glycosyltransferase family 2 protein [Puia sp.]|nr:glycosyltransferase family 2 protein [Puia sp.]
MRVAGFLFIRNAIKYDYPVLQAIQSILPLCDDMYVSVGNSEDDTAGLISSLQSPKMHISHSVWDDSLKEGGRVLAVETDKVFDQIPDGVDWCIYIQADEMIHENDYALIRAEMEKYKADQRVEGFLFKYRHFYGSYDYVGDSRRWYSHEIRIIRNDKQIRSYRDAQGFRKNGRKLRVKALEATIYHYGWVRHPNSQLNKHLDFEKLYGGDKWARTVQLTKKSDFDYSEIDSLQKFTGTHPQVMQDLISRKDWHFSIDLSRKNFNLKGWLLYWVEKYTGKRLFDYRNYEIIRGI